MKFNERKLPNEVYYNHGLIKISSNKVSISSHPTISWCSFKKSDLIIDVSGFALISKWGVNTSYAYLNNLKIARVLKVPIILMPQSFGPFDFGENQNFMDKEIADTLTYPIKIFPREYDGFFPFRERYGLKNVSPHPDIVLSSPNVKAKDIFKNPPKVSVPKVLPTSCVGVVPNLRSFDRGGQPLQTLQAFYEIIDFLLKEGKIVYLFRHSVEDITPCRWLKDLFADDPRVILWENDFSCFEYDEVCRQ
ncbi:MAG: polysaccharide pyruvyl transferase family protein, partial [Selenomonadaceae bacterium]|nr:polysaccharide pyruvyl transferase family protein [Selenomonadaceae bacterium]